ncbi:LOW QUALITY PROTEIN: 40S ribosomal protein SA-like [Suncus etruscus]|uniref:LOW QUALITY PROTEIN: 40S ribosomal protein SA-like n=1 Tax=Suncus etruscus TaxID=109475 RepID=UPI00210F9A50|nr:LOW QUALITY PROTEIN: 40S ribosomal protein SA-like [Suncus etruscus]
MSRAFYVLQMQEKDVLKFLAADIPLGGTNLDFQMEQYIYRRKSDGIYIINLKRTWEKLLLAARTIVAIENPADVSVISSRNTGQQAVLKFSAATSIAGHFTPGTFTSQIQAAFWELRFFIVTDTWADQKPLPETSYFFLNASIIQRCHGIWDQRWEWVGSFDSHLGLGRHCTVLMKLLLGASRQFGITDCFDTVRCSLKRGLWLVKLTDCVKSFKFDFSPSPLARRLSQSLTSFSLEVSFLARNSLRLSVSISVACLRITITGPS